MMMMTLSHPSRQHIFTHYSSRSDNLKPAKVRRFIIYTVAQNEVDEP